MGRGIRLSQADASWLKPSKGDSQPSVLRDSYVRPLSTVCITVVPASVASRKPTVELGSHADTCLVVDNC